jgi:hypothetical protein
MVMAVWISAACVAVIVEVEANVIAVLRSAVVAAVHVDTESKRIEVLRSAVDVMVIGAAADSAMLVESSACEASVQLASELTKLWKRTLSRTRTGIDLSLEQS